MTEPLPRITIEYCTRCNWLLRAAWLAQELLQTFDTELGEVALLPGDGGQFQINLEWGSKSPVRLWCRAQEGGFPEAKILKRRLRDQINPERDLGHNDR
ncbi:MAG: SelT/SelW/SelH family protein [Gammaproteobacteria bacterium]